MRPTAPVLSPLRVLMISRTTQALISQSSYSFTRNFMDMVALTAPHCRPLFFNRVPHTYDAAAAPTASARASTTACDNLQHRIDS